LCANRAGPGEESFTAMTRRVIRGADATIRSVAARKSMIRFKTRRISEERHTEID
jgi:hypothetical protein